MYPHLIRLLGSGSLIQILKGAFEILYKIKFYNWKCFIFAVALKSRKNLKQNSCSYFKNLNDIEVEKFRDLAAR